jgi:transcriptional regulator with XRE-family HTH domain
MTTKSLLREVRARQGLPPPALRRELRRLAGLSLEAVAQACGGVNRVTVSRWEQGTRQPRGEQLLKYAEFLESLRAELYPSTGGKP